MIIIDKLKKNFGEKIAVDIEHYEINQGDMLGLVGNNGAGKTTLFRIMLDLLKADDGKVIINDIDVSQSEDWKNITGAFIDDGFLIDYLTPEEYFYFIGKMYGLKKEEVDERLIPFERFMSGEVIGHKKLIRNYSAGNKQKIGIISAMLHYPQLLILDEPFNFLDPSSQSIIKHLLKKYNEEHQATVIISSHNLNVSRKKHAAKTSGRRMSLKEALSLSVFQRKALPQCRCCQTGFRNPHLYRQNHSGMYQIRHLRS